MGAGASSAPPASTEALICGTDDGSKWRTIPVQKAWFPALWDALRDGSPTISPALLAQKLSQVKPVDTLRSKVVEVQAARPLH